MRLFGRIPAAPATGEPPPMTRLILEFVTYAAFLCVLLALYIVAAGLQ
jgi:hypothetical protein